MTTGFLAICQLKANDPFKFGPVKASKEKHIKLDPVSRTAVQHPVEEVNV